MLKGHPKGLLVAFFANMGERFGFYTMMAILVLFLQAKYNLSSVNAGSIYSVFYFFIYALALVGGFLADRSQNYKKIILYGMFTMLGGYVLMAIPGMGLVVTVISLFVIAFGNGLFKGNLQAVVGQLYDDDKYAHLRDSAFSVFYMGINIGAAFAPFAATGMRNYWLKLKGFGYDADLPALCHQLIDGKLTDTSSLQALANTASGKDVTDLAVFAQNYIDAFSQGYHYAFGIAGIAMVVSLLVYIFFKGMLPDVAIHGEDGKPKVKEMPWEEEKPRLIALGLVFAVVIFFWMSFHQNGLTLTLFAKDYTLKQVSSFTYTFFNLKTILSIAAAILGFVFVIGKDSSAIQKGIGVLMLAVGGYFTYYFNSGFDKLNVIEPEKFQSFNPIFIVILTPIVVGFFAFLNKRNIEPSSPKKIGIGMILTAVAFVIMIVASVGLESQSALAGAPATARVSPYWLMSTYLTLTVAELFLSPMGISFVSKVSPPRFQGLMQGCWLASTAVGNGFLVIGAIFYKNFEVWQTWLMFVIFCLLAAAFIFSIMKKLEKASGEAEA